MRGVWESRPILWQTVTQAVLAGLIKGGKHRMKTSRLLTSKGLAAAALLALVAIIPLAIGCGSPSPSTSASSSAGGAVKPGGVVNIGATAGSATWDPALQPGNASDAARMDQLYEKLVYLGQDLTIQPGLATSWDTPDGKTWTFKLRDGVTFTNGAKFTSADVVYTMERLRSEKLGSPMASVFAIVKSVTAPDPLTVVFKLSSVASEFPGSLTDYRVLMLCKSVSDPAKEAVGTGPFMLKSYSPEDRAVLVKNPNYWGKAADGTQLPYLDEIDYVYSPDAAAQLEALQGGTVQWLGTLTSEQKQALAGNSQIKTVEMRSNFNYDMMIRCDRKPGSDLRVRQALWLGTDRQAIIDLVAPGTADPGNGTFVGPAYKDYYLNSSPAYDPAKAKQLLAAAGYANGLKITLAAQNTYVVPAMATAWQAQMKEIGVQVNIHVVPPDVFYADKGTDTWYQCDFGIVDWATRAAPVTYFQLALTSNAAWNFGKFKNPEFDNLTKQIVLELDATKRAELYKQAQQIIQDQVPGVIFLVKTGVSGSAKDLDGVTLAPDDFEVLFRGAHYTQ